MIWNEEVIKYLESLMRIAEDTKKKFSYSKEDGFWYWFTKGSERDLSQPFDTFAAALQDAVEPYMLFEEDDNDDE